MRAAVLLTTALLALPGSSGAGTRSPLQALVDGAAPGATIVVRAGRYEGELLIDRPLHLLGEGRPLLVGTSDGSVVRIRADGVTLDGFDIDGGGRGDLGRDASGVHVAARGATIRNCRIRNALFGIYLREADGARVEGNVIEGIHGKSAGEKGSGIHVWNTNGFTLETNTIRETRDGMYIQSSPNGVVRGNVARDLRYGLHYMYSDDNLFEDNRFENGDAGTAIMYSRRIVFRRNAFVHNRGFASVGLLFKTCDDVLAEDNLIVDNARGVFLEGSNRVTLRRNAIAESDVAIVLYASTSGLRVEGNSFAANLSPLSLEGRRTDAVFAGNYWSAHEAIDLDGDGTADLPYRVSSVFDHLRGNLAAADLYSRTLAASAVALAERAFPVLEPSPVIDATPLARPPGLPRVPRRSPRPEPPGRAAVAGSIALALLGAAALRGRA
jgi:nitrous oxidase accessory protein